MAESLSQRLAVVTNRALKATAGAGDRFISLSHPEVRGLRDTAEL